MTDAVLTDPLSEDTHIERVAAAQECWPLAHMVVRRVVDDTMIAPAFRGRMDVFDDLPTPRDPYLLVIAFGAVVIAHARSLSLVFFCSIT